MEITLNTNNVDFSVLNDTLERYSEINSEYRKNKKQLKYEKSKVVQSKNGLFSFFNKKNSEDNKDYVFKLERQVREERDLRNQIYISIYKQITNLINNSEDNKELYIKYLDYVSYTDDIYQRYKNQMLLIERKPSLDKFFNDLKIIVKDNKSIKPEIVEKLEHIYKKNIIFLKSVYKETKSLKDSEVNEQLNFSSELNLSDAYTLLNIISTLYSTIIDPVYINNNEIYVDFKYKCEFVKEYKEKINKITNNKLNDFKTNSIK